MTILRKTSRSLNIEPVGTSTDRSLQKRWYYLLPTIFVTYSLAYLDRANFGFGAAAGMAATLHMTGKQISLLSSLFFLGYFAFQLPGAAFAKKVGVSRLIFVLLIAWGLLAAATGLLHTFWLLALDRVLLGVAESLIFPAMLLLLTKWFTRAERSRANTFLILGNPVTVLWMSVMTGYLIQAIGWQKTFVVEGLPAVLWALVWISVVRDEPSSAPWMTPQAAASLEAEVAHEQSTMASVSTARAAFLRADVLLLAVLYFFWSLGIYGFVLWLPSIVQQGAALSMGRTGLLSSIPYLGAVMMMGVVSYLSDRSQRREALVWLFLLASGIALLGSFALVQKSFAAAFFCLVIGGACMYAPYGPFFAIVPERLPRNVIAEVLALINSCGALGAFLGSYFVGILRAVTGKPQAGFLLMALSLIVSAILVLCLPKVPSVDALTTAKVSG